MKIKVYNPSSHKAVTASTSCCKCTCHADEDTFYLILEEQDNGVYVRAVTADGRPVPQGNLLRFREGGNKKVEILRTAGVNPKLPFNFNSLGQIVI